MQKILLLLLSCMMSAAIARAQTESLTVVVEEPGTLAELIGDRITEITSLTVEGKINAEDFQIIRQGGRENLESVDLSNADVEGKAIPRLAFTATLTYFAPWSKIKHIKLPPDIEEIGEFAFYHLLIEEIELPAHLKKIGKRAFCEDGYLQIDEWPAELEEIGEKAFNNCFSLTNGNFPESLRVIGDFAFELSGLDSVTWPAALESIGFGAFMSLLYMESVALPDDVEIPGAMFMTCYELRSVTLNNTMTTIPRYFCYMCDQFESVTIPAQVTRIEEDAFSTCPKLSEVIFSEGLQSIGKGAFAHCAINTLVLPSTLAELDTDCFYNAVRGDIYCKAIVPPACSEDANPFFGLYDHTLYVPVGTKAAYQAANEWRDFKNIVEHDMSGLDAVAPDAAGMPVRTADSAIIVSGGSFEIYTVDGRLVGADTADSETTVSVSPGIYVVRVGDAVTKVSVR